MGKAILMEASEPTARAGNNDNDDEQFVDEAEVLETGALSALGQGKSITDNQNSTDDHDDDTSYCSNSSHQQQQQQQYDGLDDGEKERILELFDVIDYDQKGKLAKEDLCYFFTSLAERRRIKLDKRVVAMAVDALLGKNRDDSSFQGNHDDDDDDITIDRDDFLAIFAEHRDVYRVIDETEPGVHHHHEDDGFSVSCQSVDDSDETMGQPKKDPQKSFQIAMEAYWKNCRKYAFWIVLYLATCMFVFILTAIKWARNDEAVEVFGNCIVVARASAKAINFHAALVLLPITRHLTTWTRWGWLRGILFPVDALQKAHMFLGLALIFFTTTHVLAHICDYTRFLGANQDDLWLLLEDRVDDLPPLDTEGRLEWALRQRATTTGVYMLICLIPALAALFNRRQNFDRFWIFHHLLVLMLIIMCYHGTASLFEDYQTIYWVSIPLSFYLFPRVYREIKCSDAQVIHASVHEDIVDLRLRKPAHWKWVQKPGMYAVLNVPELSLLEWHPFTMSSCPSDSEVTFHIKAAGDWTKKLHSLISNASSISKSSELNFAVRLEGPFGSPSQNYRDYPVIVLIGAGMGVTVRFLCVAIKLWAS